MAERQRATSAPVAGRAGPLLPQDGHQGLEDQRSSSSQPTFHPATLLTTRQTSTQNVQYQIFNSTSATAPSTLRMDKRRKASPSPRYGIAHASRPAVDRPVSEEPHQLAKAALECRRGRSLSPSSLRTRAISEFEKGYHRPPPRHSGSEQHITDQTRQITAPLSNQSDPQWPLASRMDESLALAMSRQVEGAVAPRRALRERKAAQLHPYTTELARYKRRLIRNDWEDAVVVSREIARAMRQGEADAGSSSHAESSRQAKKPNAVVEPASTRKRRRKVNKDDLVPEQDPRQRARAFLIAHGNQQHDETPPRMTELEIDADHPNAAWSSTGMDDERMTLARRRPALALDSESGSDSESMVSHLSLHLDDDAGSLHRSPSLTSFAEDQSSPVIKVSPSTSSPELSSSNEVGTRDYEQMFKMLKRTMPARMARAYIDDLRAMDREVQEFDPPAGQQVAGDGTSQPPVSHEIQPGQARKRVAHTSICTQDDDRFALLGDSDSDSDASSAARSVISLSSTESDVQPLYRPFPPIARHDRARISMDRATGAQIHSDEQRQAQHRIRAGREDDIDRMLTRAPRRSAGTGGRGNQQAGEKRSRNAHHPNGNARPHRQDSSLAVNMAPIDARSKPSSKRTTAVANNNTSVSYLRAPKPYTNSRVRQAFAFTDDALFLHEGDDAFSFVSDVHAYQPHREPNASGNQLVSTPVADSGLQKDAHGRRPHSNGGGSGMSRPKTHLNLPDSQSLEAGLSMLRSSISSASFSHERHTMPTHVPLAQSRLAIPKTPLSEQLKQQREEAMMWNTVQSVRLDFDIKPTLLGVRCNPNGFVGKGRLYALLELKAGDEHDWNVWVAEHGDVQDLPDVEDAWKRVSPDKDDIAHGSEEDRKTRAGRRLDDFGRMMASLLARWHASAPLSCHGLIEFLDCVLSHAHNELRTEQSAIRFEILAGLHWVKIELLWRMLVQFPGSGERLSDDEHLTVSGKMREKTVFLQACQELMNLLLLFGMHRSIASVKSAERRSRNARDDGTGIATIEDVSVEYWVCLIHILCCDKAGQLSHSTSAPFWIVFSAAIQQYQTILTRTKDPVIVAENMWYTIFALCALGRLSGATGSASGRSALATPCWSVVKQALAMIRLRYDDQVEDSLPRTCLRSRDGYVRIIMQRILLLVHDWNWHMDGGEAVLARLYSIFDSHRLENLPSEEMHDFPSFLREFDARQVSTMPSSSNDEPAFHLFLRILALAGQRAIDKSGRSQGERAASRILSRFSPVRTMAFSKANVPTTTERSALFNHYSIALLYLFMVPTSDQQRLLQIQQYLRISQADSKSQVIGVRAMMYATIALLHHRRPIDSTMAWFKTVFSHLLYQLHDRQKTSPERGGELRYANETRAQITLLMTVMRALQYVIQRPSLEANLATSYPDAGLLDPAWTVAILDADTATRYPSLAVEGVRLLLCFLTQRDKLADEQHQREDNHNETGPRMPGTGLRLDDSQDDSQDSCADLFDDFDLDDAALLQAAGYGNLHGTLAYKEKDDDPHARRLTFKTHEEALVKLLQGHLSPALFNLIVCMSQSACASRYGLCAEKQSTQRSKRGTEGFDIRDGIDALVDRSACSVLGPLVVQCWTHSLWILIEEHRVRTWDSVFRYGSEDLRSLHDEEARRQVSMQAIITLLQRGLRTQRTTAVGMTDTQADAYRVNLVEIWKGLLTELASDMPRVHVAVLVNLVRQHEARRICRSRGQTDLFSDFSALEAEYAQQDADEPYTPSHCHGILLAILRTLNEVVKSDRQCQSAAIGAVSAMLSVVRKRILQRPNQQHSNVVGIDDDGNDIIHFNEQRASAAIERAREILLVCRGFDDQLARGIAVDLRKTDEGLICADGCGADVV